jgi:hypothetical protein
MLIRGVDLSNIATFRSRPLIYGGTASERFVAAAKQYRHGIFTLPLPELPGL